MRRINETFKLRAPFPCEDIERFKSTYRHDPAWRQTVGGCMVVQYLQTMFQFNITYLNEDYRNLTIDPYQEALDPYDNVTVDIYVKPMELQADMLNIAYPIQAVFMWRFGFILRRQRSDIFQGFYSQPFNSYVWSCIYASILLGSVTFYILCCWDNQLFGVECSFSHELLFAFSAYCQHILPLQAISNSRRIAYITFIICSFVIYNFYASNLLSHLVSDKEDPIDLQSIADDDYQIVLMKDMNLSTDRKKYEKCMDKNLSIVWNKVKELKVLDLPSALRAVINSKTALLTDYITLYPILRRHFELNEICQLVEIDLYSNVKSYFFTSKNFSYKEEFKIGTFRAKEAGLFRRFLAQENYKPIFCEQTRPHYTVETEHTMAPVTILISSYFVAIIILFLERLHYSRNRVWPYVN